MQEISAKSISIDATGWEGDPQGTVQEFEIWPYEQVVYAQLGIRPWEWDS